MRSQETKAAYIKLRAEGKSYSHIAKELGISKSTCSRWEKELESSIAELKQDNLDELYTSFHMTKEARIKKLGSVLKRIDDELDNTDLSKVSPERLLDYKLKYTEALKGEYSGGARPYNLSSGDSRAIFNAFTDLLNRVRTGTITDEQAARESAVLSNLLKVYELTELQAKIEALETIIGSRV